MGETVSDADGVCVGLAVTDEVLAAGEVLAAEGLDGAGEDACVAVAVTVTRAVSVAVAVAVVVVVAVATGGALTEALAAPVREADGPDVGPLAVGRVTAGALALLLGVDSVGEGVGRPLPPNVAETDGAAAVRLGILEPSPDAAHPARASPTTLTAATTRTRIIHSS